MSISPKNLVKLSLTPDFNFVVIALVSHINDFHLSWELNKTFTIDLKRTENFEITNQKSSVIQSFSLFQSVESEMHFSYSLISNKSENGLLLKEFNKFDYFFKIEGDVDKETQKEILGKLYSINDIAMAMPVNQELLKDKRLYEVFELFSEL